MQLTIYQVDAFAQKVFEGNPAAICPLDEWIDDRILQKIAMENNLSETAFFVPSTSGFDLRWFTPVEEVDLCGHATLAAAHVLFRHLAYAAQEIVFSTRSGDLSVTKSDQGLVMDFPAATLREVPAPADLISGLGTAPEQVLAASDYVVVLASEDDVEAITPNFLQWLHLDLRGVLVTAPGKDADFVSRCFFPALGINEDPVTGSAHCELAPYWGARLGRQHLRARQLSQRGGQLECRLAGNRVELCGRAVDYMQGQITIDLADD